MEATSSPTAPIFRLPPEILFQILTLLDPTDVSALSQTCHSFSSYSSPASNPHLWSTLFLNLFDSEKDLDGEFAPLLQQRIRARGLVNLARQENQLDRVVSAYEPVLDVFVAIATSSSGMEDSKNIAFLMDMFPPGTDAFTEEYLSAYDSPRTPPGAPILQSEAHFRLLHGKTWRTFQAAKRLQALMNVYQIRNFTTVAGRFGPVKKGSNEVDFELLDSIKRVMEYNVGQAITLEGWGRNVVAGSQVELPCREGWKSTAPRLDMMTRKESWDWAGVEKTWVGTYSFMDWDVFAILNGSNANSLTSLPLPSQLEAMAEAVGDCMTLKLSLTSLPPRPSDNATHPPLTFSGSLGPSTRAPGQPTLDITGKVTVDSEKQVRWSYRVIYAGQVQWVLEGVQVGGIGSKAGVVGVWTHGSRLDEGMGAGAGGPCGPFWWWPAD